MKSFVVAFSLFIPCSLIAQDFKKAVQDAHAVYAQSEQVHIIMTVSVFDDKTAKKPSYKESAEIRRDKDSFHYRFGENDMLMNEKFLVMVNRNLQEISVSKRSIKAESQFKDPVKMNFDTLARKCDEITYLGNQDNTEHYRLAFKSQEIIFMDIYFDSHTKMIRDMHYQYKEGQIALIEFQKFDQEPSFEKEAFNESQYVTIEKEKIIPVGSYRNYNVQRIN